VRENLRNKRLQMGLTQEEMASRIGIERSTYTNIELGRKNPSLAVALKIKEILQTQDDKIFLNNECQKGTFKKEFGRYKPRVLEKILQRKEKELTEAERSPCIGSGGLLALETEVAAIRKLLKECEKKYRCSGIGK